MHAHSFMCQVHTTYLCHAYAPPLPFCCCAACSNSACALPAAPPSPCPLHPPAPSPPPLPRPFPPRQNGQPLLDYDTDGYAYTGPCSAPGEVYKQVAANGMNATNLIFWNEAATDAATGAFKGNAANSIIIRSVGSDGLLEVRRVVGHHARGVELRSRAQAGNQAALALA